MVRIRQKGDWHMASRSATGFDSKVRLIKMDTQTQRRLSHTQNYPLHTCASGDVPVCGPGNILLQECQNPK